MFIRSARKSGVRPVEAVPGLDIGEDEPWTLPSASVKSPAFLFFEEGRTEVECSGLPSARPVAAIPTVLEATSWDIVSEVFHDGKLCTVESLLQESRSRAVQKSKVLQWTMRDP